MLMNEFALALFACIRQQWEVSVFPTLLMLYAPKQNKFMNSYDKHYGAHKLHDQICCVRIDKKLWR